MSAAAPALEGEALPASPVEATRITAVAAPPKPKRKTNKWLVVLSVTFGTLMGAIDASIVNVALNAIRGTVGATLEESTWISTGFAVATILVMPLTGFLGRLWGQKRVYMASLVLFLVGSVLCGLATSLWGLVFFRAIQGFGAGALQPTEQAILRQTFPPEEQGMAMALFALAIMVGPAIGPTLGGWIVDNYAWPWIFFINLPVGMLGLVMVSTFVEEPEDIRLANIAAAAEQRKHMDWAGIGLLTIGLSTLQFVLEEGNKEDWFQSRLITGLTLLSVFSIAGFIIQELTAKVPAVNLRLFKDPVFASGTIVGGLMFAMLMTLTFLLPVFMQTLLGFTATQSGLALMPRTLVMMFCIPIVGRFYTRLNLQAVLITGISLFVVSAWMMSHYTLDTAASGVVAALMVQGVAFSFLMVPLNTVALAAIPRHQITDATGLNSLVRQIGGALGLAIFTTLLSRYAVEATAAVRMHLQTTDPDVFARMLQMQGGMVARGMDAVTAQAAAMRSMAGLVFRQGYVMAFERLFLLAGCMFALVAPLAFFLRQPKKPAGQQGPANNEHVEVHVEM